MLTSSLPTFLKTHAAGFLNLKLVIILALMKRSCPENFVKSISLKTKSPLLDDLFV